MFGLYRPYFSANPTQGDWLSLDGKRIVFKTKKAAEIFYASRDWMNNGYKARKIDAGSSEPHFFK
jgi:hypothetical protein